MLRISGDVSIIMMANSAMGKEHGTLNNRRVGRSVMLTETTVTPGGFGRPWVMGTLTVHGIG